MKEKKALIVCMSPLQALISEKIIKNNSCINFTVIYICYNSFDKNYFYFKKIESNVDQAFFHFVNNRLVSFLYFKFKYKFKEYDYMYFSSFHDVYCKYIYSKNSDSTIFTYDDGFGNLDQQGVLYKNNRLKFKRKVLNSLLGIRKEVSDFRESSVEHYTIYNGKSNIIDNTKYLALFSKNDQNSKVEKNKDVTFFVGQPLNILNSKYDNKTINQILKKIDVDYYFPHPFEKYIISNIEIIKSDMIFEDFIVAYIKDNPKVKIHVVGFFSTVLLNLKSIEGIDIKSVISKDLAQDFSRAYNLIDSFNIDFYELTM